MRDRQLGSWRDAYERWRGPGALGFVVVAFGCGLAGWWLTYPQLGPADIVYNTLAMFALNFAHDGPIHPLLDVARFLAAGVVFWAAVVVAVKVISRRSPVRRAAKLRQHVVLVGGTEEVLTLATRYRDTGRDVVVIGELGARDVEQLNRRDVVTVPLASNRNLPTSDLRRIVARAERVVVIGNDESAADLAGWVRSACSEHLPTTVLVDTREFAAWWSHQYGDVALCRSTHAAIALVRDYPPFLEGAMVPPPIVFGDSEGDMAAEIVRRIVTGWQEPGERITVHCLGSNAAWVEDARASLDERAALRHQAVPPQAVAAAQAVHELVAAWPPPDLPDRVTVSGPTVYVAYGDVALTVLVASAVAEAVPNARVVGVVDNEATWMDTREAGARVVSRLALLSLPDTIELDPRRLLVGELVADAGRWPADVPGPFGEMTAVRRGVATLLAQSEPVRQAVEAVAGRAEEILGAGGVRLAQRGWAAEATFLLSPDQLVAVEAALAEVLTEAHGVAQDEARLRRLELAARLPCLAARAGWTPVAATDAPMPLGDVQLQQLAVLAHEGYKALSVATGNATGSTNYGKKWDELGEVHQRSNISQVADIPVKLATLGLTWRPASEPRRFEFDDAQLERLAENEHRRWVHFQYRNGRPGHEWNKTWTQLGREAEEAGHDKVREYDREAVRLIPMMLAAVGLEIVPLGS